MEIDGFIGYHSMSKIYGTIFLLAVSYFIIKFILSRFRNDGEKKVLYFIFATYIFGVFFYTLFPDTTADTFVFSYPAFEFGINSDGLVFTLNEYFAGRSVNLVPVIHSLETVAESGRYGLYLIVGNFIMLMPLGFLLPMISMKYNSIKSVALTAIYLILFIECFQFIVGRVVDIDDMILNLGGALIGYLIFVQLKKISLERNILKRWFTVADK